MSARVWPFSLFDSKRGTPGTRGHGPNGMPWWIARPLTLHSPSAHVHGDCWCQNLGEREPAPIHFNPDSETHDNPPVFPGVPRYSGFDGPALVAAGGWCTPTDQLYLLLPTDEDFTPHSSDTEGINEMTEWNDDEDRDEASNNGTLVDYDDVKTLRETLVGRRIVGITANTEDAGSLYRVLAYELDNGATLEAHAADGGCACSNGCFTVDISSEDRERLIGATILSVTTEEVELSWDWDNAGAEVPGRKIIDGEGSLGGDGSATITVFVYADFAPSATTAGSELAEPDGRKVALVSSEGGDNGYYGWGFSWRMVRPTLRMEESK